MGDILSEETGIGESRSDTVRCALITEQQSPPVAQRCWCPELPSWVSAFSLGVKAGQGPLQPGLIWPGHGHAFPAPDFPHLLSLESSTCSG